MVRHSYRGARQVLKAIAYGLCGGFIVLIVVAVLLTAVLMPTTIVTGLFGMNLQGIPFATRPWGFAIASALSATGAVAISRVVGAAPRW